MTEPVVSAAPAPPGMSAPVGPYAHATLMNGQVFVSGLLALDEAGNLVGGDDAGAQARFILRSLERILDAAGSGLRHVAKLNLYLLDLDDRIAVNAARREAFGDWRPASTLVRVAGLIGDGTLLEIDAVATLAEPQSPKDPG